MALLFPLYSQSALENALNALPGVRVERAPAAVDGIGEWELSIEQPLDHDGERGTFRQRLILRHVAQDRPAVLVTEGYAIGGMRGELSRRLDANELVVEHRYFGTSRPDSLDWRFLTIRQAAADHHRVLKAFRPLYRGPWVSTGISKGGQTALFYRYYYPDDVAATVAYVAPLPLGQEDPRLQDFVQRQGSDSCRAAIRAFQRALLTRRAEILPLLDDYAAVKTYSYAGVGRARALDYAALEFPFAFWQLSSGDCAAIPDSGATAAELFAYLKGMNYLYLYDDDVIRNYHPAFYQFMTELGYYGYDTTAVAGLLSGGAPPANRDFGPPEADLAYRDGYMAGIVEWLRRHGDRIIYIYGAQDSWSGAAMTLPERGGPAAAVMMVEGGWHNVRISSMSAAQQARLDSLLGAWVAESR